MPLRPAVIKRKYHGKSRGGCKTCRARKVKCDELRPICKACSRRKEECLWDTPTSSYNPFSTFLTQAAVQTLSIPPICQRPLIPFTGFNTKDLELLHNWVTHTIMSIVPHFDGSHHAYTVRAPQLAFEHKTLLHAVFALSALHLHSRRRDGDYHVYARVHCQKAILGLRQDGPSTSPDVGFLTNLVLATYWISSPAWDSNGRTPSLFEWFPAARCFITRGMTYWMDVVSGKRNDSDFLPSFIFGAACFPAPLPGLLPFLFEPDVCPFGAEELEDREGVFDYKNTLEMFSFCWSLFISRFTKPVAMYLFPGTCTDTFCQRLLSKKPRALIIAAHYVAILTHLNLGESWWFGEDRVKHDMQIITKSLSPEWLPWLNCSLAMLNMEVPSDGALSFEVSDMSRVSYPLRQNFEFSAPWMEP
ncbi:hypothetical protein DL96DRAFT_492384 [Flagelloscypha sp. PMI_526]|nr:hypothetical protein DL96DRAFT_492384 [Flagelloscypha sp. PMI_526]